MIEKDVVQNVVTDDAMDIGEASNMARCEPDTRTARDRWEPQEEGVMRTAASFPSVRNQGLSNQ
jgi:hypothetical protein